MFARKLLEVQQRDSSDYNHKTYLKKEILYTVNPHNNDSICS